MDEDEDEHKYEMPTPTWIKTCPCGAEISRYRGESYVYCTACDREFNAFGQELVSNWRRNPSWEDDEIGDLEGAEIAALREEESKA